MDDTTTIDALEAELDALLADSQAMDMRVEALLQSTGSTAARMADLALRMEHADHELAVQERYQRRIARALEQAA